MYQSSLQSAVFLIFSHKPTLNSKLIHVLATGTKLMLLSLIIYVGYSLPIIIYKYILNNKA